MLVLSTFKENFNKAKEFNKYLKLGDKSKLVMAPVIVEKKEETTAPKEGEKKPEAKAAERKASGEKQKAEEKPKAEESKK